MALTELKKEERERDAYPAYRHRMREEIGDFLWYLVRLVTVVDRDLLTELDAPTRAEAQRKDLPSLAPFLGFGGAVGEVLAAISKGGSRNTPKSCSHSPAASGAFCSKYLSRRR